MSASESQVATAALLLSLGVAVSDLDDALRFLAERHEGSELPSGVQALAEQAAAGVEEWRRLRS